MPRVVRLLVILVLLAGCSAGPEPVKEGPLAEELETRSDPCAAVERPTHWLEDSVISAIEDQQASLCSCFREAPRGTRVYVALYLHGDGSCEARILGRDSEAGSTARCFSERVEAAVGNWLALKPAWYREDAGTHSADAPGSALVQIGWDGLVCRADDADLPIGEPVLSPQWLTTNGEGVLFPQDVPPRECWPRVRRGIQVNFPVSVTPRSEGAARD